jgi:hypothetical protein
MRDTNQWWRPLYNDIKEHFNKENLPQNLPSLFKTEFGIWLAVELGLHPNNIWAVLAMSNYVNSNWTEDEKSMIAISSFYISDDRRSWNESIQRYRALDSNIRLFDVDQGGSISGHIPFNVLTKKRDGFYRKLSTTPPVYKKSGKEYAEPNKKYFYKIRTTDNRRIIREVTLPAEWAKYVPQADRFFDINLPDPRPIVIRFDELLEISRFLDTLEDKSKLHPPVLNSGKWVERFDNIILKKFQEKGLLQESHELLLENTFHLPGTLSVGKSTLAFLIAVWSVIKGYRITLVFNDVSSILRFTNEINQRLLHPFLRENPDLLPHMEKAEISRFANTGRGSSAIAVPILGRSSRSNHIEQMYQDSFEDAKRKNVSHLDHYGWRYLSTACAVDAYSLVTEDFIGPIPTGEFPCERLSENNSDGKSTAIDRICPLLGICPVHEASRDLAFAPIWVCSPASLVSSRIFSNMLPYTMSYYELVYRMSDIVIIDECDQVQSTFDDIFLPSSILAGPGQGHLLNDLAQRVAHMKIDKRSLPDQASRKWVRSMEVANSVTDQIYDILTTPSSGQIRKWIGEGVFWNMNLFSMITWQLMGVKPEDCTSKQKHQHEEWLNRLGKFASSPLDFENLEEDELLFSLNQIASALVASGHTKQIQIRCTSWVEQAQKEIRTSKQKDPRSVLSDEENYWSSIAGKLEFAILVCVLDDQLTLVELNWSAAPSELNLDEYSSLQERDRELRPFILAPPTGRIFGFQYKHEKFRPVVDGILRRIRFAGMGRWALMHFHDLFWNVDKVKGPQTLLLSGTSWSPSSPFFHVHIPPQGILDTKLQEKHVTDWLFKPVSTPRGIFVSISGAFGDQRQEQLQTAARLISRPGQAISQVLYEIEKREKNNGTNIWNDRQRILILTGSYKEAFTVAMTIQQAQPNLQVAYMSRGDELMELSSTGLLKVGTGEVNRFALLYPESKVFVAPIDAIGRGRNILNPAGKAAFGSIFFLIRSLLPPNDPSADARHLMHWILSKENIQVARESFGIAAEDFRQQARTEWYRLMSTKQTWKNMEDDDRQKLASTLFTRIWQAVGRGIRGNVPVIIVFVDSKWAPESAKDKADSARTSLLLAMRECYEGLIFSNDPFRRENQIATALYNEPISGLQQIQGIGSNKI